MIPRAKIRKFKKRDQTEDRGLGSRKSERSVLLCCVFVRSNFDYVEEYVNLSKDISPQPFGIETRGLIPINTVSSPGVAISSRFHKKKQIAIPWSVDTPKSAHIARHKRD